MDLSHKHIFFYGDSTTRQMYGAFLKAADSPIGNMNFLELKGHVRNECRQQLPVQRYYPTLTDSVPCYLNEVTCHNLLPASAFGSNITVTLDWKHFIYEDYDRYLFNQFVNDPSGGTKPDILILSPGHHDCFHHPKDIQHHLHALQALAHHLAHLGGVKVVWVDGTMFTDIGAASQMDNTAGGGEAPRHRPSAFADAASCVAALNQKGQRIAKHYGWLFFSRNHWMASNPAVHADVRAAQKLEVHLPEHLVQQYVALMLNHMACQQYF